MGHGLHRLAGSAIRTLGPGKHRDGAGLDLVREDDGAGRWVLRLTVHGRRREMGLGSAAEVGLREARERAATARATLRTGHDPIRLRETEAVRARRNLHVLADVPRDAFEARGAELKGDGLAGRWMSPLEQHVLPKLGRTPVSEITQVEIRDVLRPLWHTKAETARKGFTRLGLVLKHAAVLGLEVDLRAPENARALLGKSCHKASHIPTLPWAEVPAFYASLADGTVTHLALRLLILRGCNRGPCAICARSSWTAMHGPFPARP